MKVKFIVARGKGIILGDKEFKSDQHCHIAKTNKVKEEDVLGGGIADLTDEVIFGKSYAYGPYKPEKIRQLLPDWLVEEPSDYEN